MNKIVFGGVVSCIIVLLSFNIVEVEATDGVSTEGPSGGGAKFENPVGFDSVDEVLANILSTVQGIVAVLAVLMIVIGGILYITSAGDTGRIETAKKAVTAALIGLALAIAAPSLLYEIYSVLDSDAPANSPSGKSLSAIIMDTLNLLLSVLGTLAIIMLVVGGIMYMTSGGEDTRIETAKNTIKFAIIGLIVALVSLVIVTQIGNIFT